jgi:hypothetical protein
MIGPNRDGFSYVAIMSTSERWGEQYYRAGEQRRFVTINFTTTVAPADPTAGSL